MADVAETSTLWSNVLPLYNATIAAVKARFQQDDGTGFIGCHISHTYETGAWIRLDRDRWREGRSKPWWPGPLSVTNMRR